MSAATHPEIIGPAIHRLGGLTLCELHDHTRLPACFIEELLMNDFRPDTSWAAELQGVQLAEQYFRVFQFLPRELPSEAFASPHVCYHTTVIFYDRSRWREGNVVELSRVDLTPRTGPNLSFIERKGEYWEVTGGCVRWDEYIRRWIWWHHCQRNTELARHFRGLHGSDCVPCRQIEFIRAYGHGNYGQCDRCQRVLCLVPDRVKGPVVPRHHHDGAFCPGGEFWPARILEPAEAKTLLSPEGSL